MEWTGRFMGERTGPRGGGSGAPDGDRSPGGDGAAGGVPWNDLAAFLAVARLGGLSAAARATSSSAPTLGRRMRALERRLGRELFVRRTHGYDLTGEGARLCRDLAAAEAGIARATAPPPGEAPPLVRIAAGTWTMLALVDALPAILGDPPDLRVRLVQGEDVLSIPRREAAIGFRSRRPVEPGLAGRRLRRVEFAPFATPGAPDRWVVVRADTPSARWVAGRCGDRIACETTVPRLALDLALKGLGRVLLPGFLGDRLAPLGRVGPPVEELAHEQWLVSHDEDRRLPEVRAALDRIAGTLG